MKENLDQFLESVCYRGMIFSPSLKHSIDHRSKTPLFYNIRRKVFDHELVKFAQESGAELKRSHVREVTEDNEKVTVTLADGTELTAKGVVGATGPYDPAVKYLREKYGLPKAWGENEIGTILVQEFDVPRDFIDDAYGEERTSFIHLQTAGLLKGDYGYGWVFSKNDVLNIGWGGFKKDMKKVDRKQLFIDYLNVLKKDGFAPEDLELETFKGAPLPLKGTIPKSYYNRMLIVGDAAGFVSPISEEGIYYAMDSGRLAAQVLDRASSSNDFSRQSLSEYQRLWKASWGRDISILKIFANRLMAWPEALIRYGMKDEVLKQHLVDIFISTRSAYDLKTKVASRVVRNFLLRN